MRRTSLVKAKAHLSALVDAAEHRGQRILILRHGKPAAAIVPVAAESGRHWLMTPAQAKAFLDEIAASAPRADIVDRRSAWTPPDLLVSDDGKARVVSHCHQERDGSLVCGTTDDS